MMKLVKFFIFSIILTSVLTSCARMGNPDGGWYDETPPHVVGASPADKGINCNSKKVIINFDEFIKIENASEKVVISPPQMEQAEIKATGKRIVVELHDSLKANTTYTIDFSDAISDNNEGNPLGNYTYSFSTGSQIDTMEVSGTVLAADNLEPVKGTLVGLYKMDDSQLDSLKKDPASLNHIFKEKPFLRVSRTDSRGRFVIRGIAPGSYKVVALTDMDDNFYYSQAAEAIAFNHDIIVPTCGPDVRQDTIWSDSLHIRDIKKVNYIHYRPDDIILREFTKEQTDRFFLKSERKEANMFQLFFSGPSANRPIIKGMNFNENNAFVTEFTTKNDTCTYWLRDSTLINNDTLRIQMTYDMTDSTGVLVPQTDTIEILSKQPYEKRMKQMKKEYEEWHKKLEKKLKKGEEVTDTIFPQKALEPKYSISQQLAPDQSLYIDFPAPLAKVDTSAIHLYIKQDDKWYNDRIVIRQKQTENSTPRNMEILAEWRPETEYSFEIDTLAFEDIYGHTSMPYKTGIKVKSLDEFSSLFVHPHYSGSDSIIVQMLDKNGKTIKESLTVDGTAEFYYLKEADYYLRAIIDRNGNGKWDTGDYDKDLQPEDVYYYPEKVTCRAKWDVTRDWNLTSKPLDQQKPGDLVKAKAEKKTTIKQRNLTRAKQLGITPPESAY